MNNLRNFLTTTRVTGLLYLGLALTGMVSFLFAKSQIYVENNASETLANLIEKENLARIGIATELALVAFQAFAAIWFYKLFKAKDSFSAGILAVFGLINAVAILIASALWLSALNSASSGASASNAYTLFNTHETIWLVSSLFFGLWLLPMGYLARKAQMPRYLAGILIAGGVGYIISAFILILAPDQDAIANLLVTPATIGEFWMIGYLLTKSKLNS